MLMDQARQQKGAPAPQQGPAMQGAAPQDGAAPAAGAATAGDSFTPPDWKQFTPPELVDTVERIVAAGAKLMYSPDMRDELKAGVESQDPPDKKLAENAVGLLLTLDKQAQGGLPVEALFPAAMGLMAECVAVMAAAGQPVTQEDFNDAALNMFAIIGKKLGGSDEGIMQAAQKMQGGQGDPAGDMPEGSAPDMRQDAAPGGEPHDDEEAAMKRGFAA